MAHDYVSVAWTCQVPCPRQLHAVISHQLQLNATHAVPLTDVRLTDSFWGPRLEINRRVTIPHVIRENEGTGRVDNFRHAARALGDPSAPRDAYTGQRYNDTDVYKIIEAASYTLAADPDPALDKKLDELIGIIAAAQ
jgi:DUF1680 family protein